ncbi:MAG TPA: methyltransferase domain-containing protein [Gammaproteobacteria bacterium]|nr:methyltransferase domain-containing protein [Gammaproteobacteria bacterium]
MLACPACGDAAGLARRTDHFACGACKARFPVYKSGAAQVPWLFRDPEAARLEWRARFNGFLHANAVECSRLEAALRDRRLSKRAAERIRRVLDARVAQKRQVLELLAPLSLGAPRAGPLSDRSGALHAALPRQQGLTSYYSNVFRDWSWGNGENEALLQCVERVASRVPQFKAGKLLTLGAGAGRLSYDVHRAYRPELSVALDLNPLLVLLASRVVCGEKLAFHELPIAPLDQASFAVARSLSCPEPLSAGDNFVLVLGDALHAPFRPASFDTVLTPWLVDIVPQSFAECAAAVSRLLAPGGIWVNTGSLAFFHRNEAWCHSEEEALELVAAHGFEILASERVTVPYLQSPASAHGRVERVLSFSARKIASCPRSAETPYLPPWLLESERPIPDLDELVVASATHLLKATVLAAIDGRRSIDDIASLIAKRYGLQKSEAKGAVERILIEIHDAAALVSRDRLPELE